MMVMPAPRRLLLPLIALAASLVLPMKAVAHEIPSAVQIQTYVRPESGTLRVLVRVPLASMRDMSLPLYGPGFIVLGQEEPHISQAAATWLQGYLTVLENGNPIEGRVSSTRTSLPSDPSFISYSRALGHFQDPPLTGVELMWDQALLDVLLEYPIASAASDFALEPRFAHLGVSTTTTIRFLPTADEERIFQFHGDPGLVRLDPRWHQAALTFVRLGFRHILDGIDHLLFLLCLVIPLRRVRPLIAVVTSFTVAHSITLIAAALGMAPSVLWFPPLIETLIALSILYMAIENVVGVNTERRWMVAFAFGLIHGFGFSFLLTDSLQFAGRHLITSLLAFNVGVELGQIAVLLVAVPVLSLAFARVVDERVGTVVLSVLVAHTAWHWMLDRGRTLGSYEYRLPSLDAAFLAMGLRWLSLLVFAGGAVWLLQELFGRAGLRRPGEAAPLNPPAVKNPRPKVVADTTVSR